MKRTSALGALAVTSALLFAAATVGLDHTVRREGRPQTITFPVSKPRDDGALHANVRLPLFELSVTVDPPHLTEDSDAKVTVSVTRVRASVRGDVEIRLGSESFRIIPAEGRPLRLVEGESALFVVTPKGKGSKKLHVYAQFRELPRSVGSGFLRIPVPAAPPFVAEKVVDVAIAETPAFLGLPRYTLSVLQLASVAIGLPSILLLIITRWLDRRRPKDNETSRIIAPR